MSQQTWNLSQFYTSDKFHVCDNIKLPGIFGNSKKRFLSVPSLMTVYKEIATFHTFNNIYFDCFLYSHLFSTVALVIDLVVCFSRLVTIFPPSHHLRYSTQALSLSAPILPSVLFVLLKLFSSWSLCAFGGIFVGLFTKIGVKILRRRT